LVRKKVNGRRKDEKRKTREKKTWIERWAKETRGKYRRRNE